MVRTTHIRHKVLSTDAQFVAVTLVVGGLVIAVPKLLNQMGPVYLNVIQLLALSGDQHVYLITSKANNFIQSKNNFVYV